MLWALHSGVRCWARPRSVQQNGATLPSSECFDRKVLSVKSFFIGKDFRPPINIHRFLKMFNAERHAKDMGATSRTVQMFGLHRFGVRLEVESKIMLMKRFYAADRNADGVLNIFEVASLFEIACLEAKGELPPSCCTPVPCLVD